MSHEEIDVYRVVRRLIGEITPVGDSRTDDRRFQSLKATTELIGDLIHDVERVAQYRVRAEFSMKRAGEYAQEFLEPLGEE